jgi:polyphosphate kinase 2 (PPK2 family)
MLHQIDTTHEVHGRIEGSSGDLEGGVYDARDRKQEHRSVAKYLLHGGREEAVLAIVEAVDDAGRGGRIVGEKLERPRQLRCGRLVPRKDH